ncbi:hypothetical protein G7Z17_g1865 [Cylindrodendrum hubeiense]|uniref:Cyclin n=1 Tax=Cylindrodendrum hubeiense TaxID=595255 RepID=A0A9P5HIK2_9HYPO|nr:hypothetical protein G7Z17_g1865 [Cylindrodendrum hubeiense]
MIANPSIQHQHSHDSSSSYRSASRSRHSATPRAQVPDSTDEYSNSSTQPAVSSPAPAGPVSASASASAPATAPGGHGAAHVSVTGGASRFPSPPPSSSPSVATGPVTVEDGTSSSMASDARDSVPLGHAPRSGRTPTNTAQQPSPSSDDFQIPNPSLALTGGSAPRLISQLTPQPEQTVIHIRDLAHIQSLASADMLSGNGSGILNDPPLQQMKYEISGMPIGDIIEMVAALLTKITTTNDLQHDAMQRNVAHQQQANQSTDTSGSPISPLNHSVLAFHGKNVPAITILSYLSRIHKYCPTTYEVFLSLLVYFDRMTERVNDMVMRSEEARRQTQTQTQRATSTVSKDTHMRDDGSDDSDESDSDLADDDEDMEDHSNRPSRQSSNRGTSTSGDQSTLAAATYFVVDSFNIHRLIISGVTCASKFFSDVFYTNSRYAKVGGLPLVELNHLELQFLLLNDFRLAVPVEDLEAYATMLVEFYAREVVAKQSGVASAE